MKRCSLCREDKPLDQFSRNRSNSDGLQYRCKPCCLKYYYDLRRRHDPYYAPGKKRAPRTPAIAPISNVVRNRLRQYGLSPCDYTRMRIEQADRCAVCGKTDFSLSIDHCHRTGVVRGLLCTNCNTGLGKLGDSIEGLTRALDYLRKIA